MEILAQMVLGLFFIIGTWCVINYVVELYLDWKWEKEEEDWCQCDNEEAYQAFLAELKESQEAGKKKAKKGLTKK